MKLGEILINKGLIEEQHLEFALEKQLFEKSPIGRILIGQNYIRNFELHKAIAEKYGLEFVDLIHHKPDQENFEDSHKSDYFRLEIVPYRINSSYVILAVCNINDEIKSWAVRTYPAKEIRFVITSPNDIRICLQRIFLEKDNEIAQLSLWKKMPFYSARKLFASFPIKTFILSTALIAGFVADFNLAFLSFVAAMNILFLAATLFKAIIFSLGNGYNNNAKKPVSEFPIYTILLPLYQEKNTLPQLITAIKNLDYPKSKLDVKFVVEADDDITINAIKNLAPPAYMEIIQVPFSLPRTKPKACNYALEYARGEYVTIYDAEDQPDPQQLKKVLSRFVEDEKIAVVQARLNYYNYDDSQLTRWFALEYGIWFDYVIRGFDRLKMALPLGGTSNHIKTSTLREVGGWDAFNVTEDADLGMRLVREGYLCSTVNSLTEEEAPNKIGAWFKQRRRWMKGFMQTYIVHMRSISQLIPKVGINGFLGLQFFIGLPLVIYLVSPILLVSVGFGEYQYPNWLLNLMFVNLFFGSATHMFMAAKVANEAKNIKGKKLLNRNMFLSIITFPVYFFLHIIASYMALFQLISDPHYWDKTEHGTSKHFVAAQRLATSG